tara:strand:- start:812 stop:1228 length:417 start_codon:yes stop_codon:yes gene_type:complete
MNATEISLNFTLNFLAIIKNCAANLKLTQSQALCICSIPFDGISQADLSKKLSLDISTLSRNLDKLIQLDLISKQSSPLDRRSYKIKLTSEGSKVYMEFINLINSKIDIIFNQLSLENKENLENILNQLNWKLSIINK